MRLEQRLKILVEMTDAEAKSCLKIAEKMMYEGRVDTNLPEVKTLLPALDRVSSLPQYLLLSYINHLEVVSESHFLDSQEFVDGTGERSDA